MNEYLKWLSEKTPTVYWNDSAIPEEVENVMKYGATGVTTNPVIVTSTLSSEPDFWKPYVTESGLTGEELAIFRTRGVAKYLAEKFAPLRKNGLAGEGYVCAQVDPTRTFDKDYMVAAAAEIQSWASNIVVKLPATKAGIEAYEECVARGINVAGTLGFTVPQVIALGEAQMRGAKRAREQGIEPGLAIAVMMVGRLDDYLRDCAKDNGLSIAESDIRQAGIACMKRAYKIFSDKGYETYLMPAGLRTPEQVTELAGAKMIFSVAPKIGTLLEGKEQVERIDIPVAEDVIDRLSVMKEFCRAYQPDGLTADEFIAYGVVNRTTTFFIENGWNRLVAK